MNSVLVRYAFGVVSSMSVPAALAPQALENNEHYGHFYEDCR